ncbi:MAG TPA: gliding motility-associated C-terminal domain-containing protein [Flavobacteriales bacterium]|nr:gliding motility-associated C-terminal domain-containing protein [Flavobacteriales bacterium]
MKTFFTSFLIFVAFHLCVAQKEANYWHFGSKACVSFKTGLPYGTAGSAMIAIGGSSSISDKNGNLLFYTDGSTIWNKLNTIVPGGNIFDTTVLNGQPALFIPQPGNDSIYYLFSNTINTPTLVPGIWFTIINKNLDGGNGAVISGPTYLGTDTCSGITATLHANGTDVWVTTSNLKIQNYYSYLLTAGGLSTTPVINHVGPTIAGLTYAQLKASPLGNKLVAIPGNFAIVFDFNRNTANMGNHLVLVGMPSNAPSGFEFSPDESKIYFTSYNPCGLYQYDLSSGDENTINQTFNYFETELYTTKGKKDGLEGMLLGPDGRIYIGRYNHGYLSIINNPNAKGAICNYQPDGVELKFGPCRYHLPNIFHKFIQPAFTWVYSCSWQPTYFTVQNTNGLIAASWDFGDPASGSLNTSTQTNASHIFTEPGTYPVTLIANYGTHVDTTKEFVSLYYTDSLCNEEGQEFVPLAFSPNDDGNNDILFVRGDNIASMHFVVYDRWGNVMFETADQSIGWNGFFKNNLVNPGTYAWKLEFVLKGEAERKIKSGKIILVK